eukprot:SAG11_NODE_23555_length_386_cov_1.982578_1_plen_37_part_01
MLLQASSLGSSPQLGGRAGVSEKWARQAPPEPWGGAQ